MFFTDSMQGYYLTYNMEYETLKLISTTDGGESWSSLSRPSSRPNSFVHNNDKLFIQYNNSALVSTDRGQTWMSNSSAAGNSICFVDNLNGYLISNDSIGAYIKRTTDGGIVFNTIYQENQSKSLSSILFIDTLKGLYSGTNGTYITTNGGLSWQRSAYENFRKMSLMNDGKIFGYSSSGGVYFLDGFSFVTNMAITVPNPPNGFSLYQNYPNPFNPSTKLKYALPEREYVTAGKYSIAKKLMFLK